MIPQEADQTHIEYGFPVGDHAGSGSERKMTGTRLNYEQHRATSIFIVLSTPVTPTKRKHQKFLQKWCFVLKCLPRVNL